MILYTTSRVTGSRRFERPYHLLLLRHIPKDLTLSNAAERTTYLTLSSKFRIRNKYKKNLVTKSEYMFFPP